MKKIIETIENNFLLSIIFKIIWFITLPLILVGFSLTPIVIGKFTIGLSENISFWCFLCIFWGMFPFYLASKYENNDRLLGKIMVSYAFIGVFSASVFLFDMYLESSPRKIVSNVPSSSYNSRREYSSDYSSYNPKPNSNYRYSEPSDYIPHTKIPDDKDISYVPHIETETLIPSKTEEENENQSFSEPIDINTPEIDNSREEKKISSTSSEIYIHDNWEYVTSDESGNKYYISKTFGVFNTTNNIEGTVFHALFRKVLSGNGIEVEVPAYDINRGMITEKKILAYEESVICFRNENGFREIRFSTITGRTADNSVIVGWAIANIDNIYNWQLINNEIYNALYDSAYKKL